MEFPEVTGLSPSSMGSFTKCPLAFRFAYVERIPEPPSPAASKGTLVHRALELLFARPSAERTVDAALADLATASAELAAHPEFSGLDLDPAELARFEAEAAALVRNYFSMEDPASISPKGLELRLSAQLPRVTLRGVIDRLDVGTRGELVVTDYKTGSPPKARYEDAAMLGVRVYSLLCEQHFGQRPERVQLLYLGAGEVLSESPTESMMRSVESRAGAIMAAVDRARANDDFRPKPGPLCNWCSFQEFCPSFGGDPALAGPVMRERAEIAAGRPPLPFSGV